MVNAASQSDPAAAAVAAKVPLGQRGLPATQVGLDGLVDDMCRRLAAAGEKGVRGRQLACELNLTGTRALRLLVAYGQLARGRRRIIGIPGYGYRWSDDPGETGRMARHAERMGRDWFAKAGVYRGQPPAGQLALFGREERI